MGFAGGRFAPLFWSCSPSRSMEALPVLGTARITPSIASALAEVWIGRFEENRVVEQLDVLAVEEPLEIRLMLEIDGPRVRRTVSVTMRTPGHDEELALGFLFTEGLLTRSDQVESVNACHSGSAVRVDLKPGVAVDLARIERHFYAASSCGVCGKASLDAVRVNCGPRMDQPRPLVDPAVISRLPRLLSAAQPAFERTGGLHASALFDSSGALVALREDVGRHNALDKLIGSQFVTGRLPLSDSILLVSGRASFELVQKAAVAGIPVLAAVGAPSSLAAELAAERGMTLLGFVRDDRFNVYTGSQRVARGVRQSTSE
jgi:FdhD protein